MPAETHQRSDAVEAPAILDLLATVLGIDGADVAGRRLAELELDDDLAILHLWDAVVEEFGERSVGQLDIDDPRPATVGGLTTMFHHALSRT